METRRAGQALCQSRDQSYTLVLLVGAPALKLRVQRGFHPITRLKVSLGPFPSHYSSQATLEAGLGGRWDLPRTKNGSCGMVFSETEIDKQTNQTDKFGLLALP